MYIPRVSVIMNCHNCDEFLNEALDSVYSQTYSNWEIIFWDNFSTDQSENIAKSYGEKLKYFKTKKKLELGTARADAVKKAKGEYLAFLDCDDLWGVKKLEKQVALADSNSDIGIIYSRCEVITGSGLFLKHFTDKNISLNCGDIFGELLKEDFIPFVSALVPRKYYEQVGGFHESHKHATDYYLFLKLSEKYKVFGIDDILCQVRLHANNLTKSQQLIGAKEDIAIVRSFLPDKRAKNALKIHYATLVIMYVREKEYFNALITLIRHGGLLFLLRRIIIYISKINMYEK